MGFVDSLSNRLLSVYCKSRLAVRIDQPHVQSVDEQLTFGCRSADHGGSSYMLPDRKMKWPSWLNGYGEGNGN